MGNAHTKTHTHAHTEREKGRESESEKSAHIGIAEKENTGHHSERKHPQGLKSEFIIHNQYG